MNKQQCYKYFNILNLFPGNKFNNDVRIYDEKIWYISDIEATVFSHSSKVQNTKGSNNYNIYNSTICKIVCI